MSGTLQKYNVVAHMNNIERDIFQTKKIISGWQNIMSNSHFTYCALSPNVFLIVMDSSGMDKSIQLAQHGSNAKTILVGPMGDKSVRESLQTSPQSLILQGEQQQNDSCWKRKVQTQTMLNSFWWATSYSWRNNLYFLDSKEVKFVNSSASSGEDPIILPQHCHSGTHKSLSPNQQKVRWQSKST